MQCTMKKRITYCINAIHCAVEDAKKAIALAGCKQVVLQPESWLLPTAVYIMHYV